MGAGGEGGQMPPPQRNPDYFVAMILFFQVKCLISLLRSLQSEKLTLGSDRKRQGSSTPPTNQVSMASVPYQVLVTGKVFRVTMFSGGGHGNSHVSGQPAVRVSIFNPTGIVTSSLSDLSVEVNCFNMVVSATDSSPHNSKHQRLGGMTTWQEDCFLKLCV